QVRRAVEIAGLISSEEQYHVQLLTAGEVSLHFYYSDEDGYKSDNQGVIVVDAGGGTIDLAYSMNLS
ncbi:hypothetical protein DEU56DRAFT_716900, partial [Suillus clintonianus]|uniref:uncharacterized protein n=1 Tax=Suillus clintonianus TaxID=1904413 RepID=UPI001B85DC93